MLALLRFLDGVDFAADVDPDPVVFIIVLPISSSSFSASSSTAVPEAPPASGRYVTICFFRTSPLVKLMEFLVWRLT